MIIHLSKEKRYRTETEW